MVFVIRSAAVFTWLFLCFGCTTAVYFIVFFVPGLADQMIMMKTIVLCLFYQVSGRTAGTR